MLCQFLKELGFKSNGIKDFGRISYGRKHVPGRDPHPPQVEWTHCSKPTWALKKAQEMASDRQWLFANFLCNYRYING